MEERLHEEIALEPRLLAPEVGRRVLALEDPVLDFLADPREERRPPAARAQFRGAAGPGGRRRHPLDEDPDGPAAEEPAFVGEVVVEREREDIGAPGPERLDRPLDHGRLDAPAAD